MLKVDTSCMETQAQRMNRIAEQLEDIASRIASVNRTLQWNSSVEYKIRRSLAAQSKSVSTLDNKAASLSRGLHRAASLYSRVENKAKPGDRKPSFWEEFFDNYGWKELLAGSNYIGKIYDLVNDIRDGKTWGDLAEAGLDVVDFITDAAKTFKNYKKIGNAVGTKTAMAWWVKNITGLKPLGRASTAKNPFTRFANNLTNKTSPFNAQFKNTVKNFTGKNGVGKAVASWGQVAVTGVMNFFSNKDEQAASNGTMSNGRVWAETITETAVDTVLTYGSSIVVGAAVTAALGTVAAPGIVVVAVSGAVVAGINAGVKALTGETLTEWVSDGIIDTAGKIGNAAKSAAKSVGKWFKKLSFA